MTAYDLIRFADLYSLSRETTAIYARQVRNRCAEFAAYAGERELTAELLNLFIVELAKGRKPITVRGYRTAILSVLKYGKWHPEIDVRSVGVGGELLECFTAAEIESQIKAASRMKGELPNGMNNANFWTLAIHSGYGIAVRQADLLAVRRVDVRADGTYVFQPSKTRRYGHALPVRFPPAAMTLIRRHGQEKAVPWPYSQEHFRQEFKALLIAAGVRRGCWKWLRRSAGTYAELERAGSGHRLLGNSTRIFQRHYDASATIDPRPVEPPRIGLSWWRRLLNRGA